MSQSLELVNRHPANNILSFDVMKPGDAKSPGSMKRRVAPVGCRIKPNEKIDLCKHLECDWETANAALEGSPQAMLLLRRNWMARIDKTGAGADPVAAKKAQDAAKVKGQTPQERAQEAEAEAAKKAEEAKKKAEEAAAKKAEEDAAAAEKAAAEAAKKAEEAANAPPPETAPAKSLQDMDKAELLALAKQLGVKPKRGMKVSSLIKAIEEKQAKQETPKEPSSEE
jgi:flagellar biosynthesis GTPase FlhF